MFHLTSIMIQKVGVAECLDIFIDGFTNAKDRRGNNIRLENLNKIEDAKESLAKALMDA